MFNLIKKDQKSDYKTVLDYWFAGDPKKINYMPRVELWFWPSAKTDKLMTEKFGELLKDAENGKLDSWKTEMKSGLALVILLDQFSRNIYRGTSKMFSNDNKANAVAKELISREFEFYKLSFCEKVFVFLTFGHSEDLEANKLGYDLIASAASVLPKSQIEFALDSVLAAKQNYEEILKFGRYPYRNELLGRESIEEELIYLKKVGSQAKKVKSLEESTSDKGV